jgi:N-acetyllactosaminide alpha-2,3-sialyltransferase
VKSLFICGTPLQSLIAAKIIEKNNLTPDDCSLFFYSGVRNKKYDYYYRLLSERCSKSVFYYCDFKFPSYLAKAKEILSDMEYQSVYLASVNSVFSLLALSLGKHSFLYTFDDGTANLSSKSSYAATYGLTIKKYLGLKLFGNSYSIDRIRKESLGHYTIYPDFRNNISHKLIPVTIVDTAHYGDGVGKCAVILGTVFREAYETAAIPRVIEGLGNLSATLGQHVYFVPHPRDEEVTLQNCEKLDSDKIAEDVISDLLLRYATVDLYGFCSSTQINMAHVAGISNRFLTITGTKPLVWEMFNLASQAGISPAAVIDLDDYG